MEKPPCWMPSEYKVAVVWQAESPQHIGLIRLNHQGQRTPTGTPRTCAFTAAGARRPGRDVVVLVVVPMTCVAANQRTIAHAKAASVTIIVAMNKIDAGRHSRFVKKQLADAGLCQMTGTATHCGACFCQNNTWVGRPFGSIILVADNCTILQTLKAKCLAPSLMRAWRKPAGHLPPAGSNRYPLKLVISWWLDRRTAASAPCLISVAKKFPKGPSSTIQ